MYHVFLTHIVKKYVYKKQIRIYRIILFTIVSTGEKLGHSS